MNDSKESILALVARFGYERREKPFRLSSGYETHDYIDGKLAIADGSRLRAVGQAFLDLAEREGVEFDAVGGLTMGADALSTVIATESSVRSDRQPKRWFFVRKDAKEHGKQKLIEGAILKPGERVMLVDDVVTTGRSIVQALDAIEAAGGRVVLATTLVDRGKRAKHYLSERNVLYRPLLTYRDLGIQPVPDA